ncbi:MAG: hypothetical protein ACKVOT_09220 [Polaromonas sp.]
MGLTNNPAGSVAGAPGASVEANTDRSGPLGGFHDLSLQCLRVLRCTAHAMANSPGGLRFKAGTRPWLEGLPMPVSARQPASQAF